MSKFSLLLPSAILPVVAFLHMATPVHAGALACQSVDGNTVCAGPGSLSCQTINGKTTCVHGPDMRCRTQGDETTCRNGAAPRTFRAEPPSESNDDADDDRSDDDRAPSDRRLSIERNGSGQRLRIEQGIGAARPGVSIERNGGQLHIRNGGVEVRIE